MPAAIVAPAPAVCVQRQRQPVLAVYRNACASGGEHRTGSSIFAASAAIGASAPVVEDVAPTPAGVRRLRE